MSKIILEDKKISIESISKLSSSEIANLKLSRQELLSLLSETITEKNKFEAILQNIDNGVFAVDWDGKLILYNRAAERITGLAASDVIGRYCEEVLYVVDTKGNVQSADIPLAEALAHDKEVSIPFCYLKVGRKKIASSITYNPIKGIKDDLVLGICVFKDLRKQEELERMKNDFVAMAAHELRTPLTSIRGYLSILDEELTDIDDEYKEFIKRAIVSSTQLDTLVKNILSVSKIERGKISLTFESFSVQEFLDGIIPNFDERLKAKKLTLKVKMADKIETICGDREKLQEVLINFVSNAISYTPDGGSIKLEVLKKNDMAEFRVTDTGIGLGPQERKRLFRKFSRIKNQSTSQIKGTGLGLYISKLIIDMHKGKIGVESKGLSKGSSFYFRVPINCKNK